jgi:hypothetical protein
MPKLRPGARPPPGWDLIEPTLTEPTFVLDYPARHAALAEVRGPPSARCPVSPLS